MHPQQGTKSLYMSWLDGFKRFPGPAFDPSRCLLMAVVPGVFDDRCRGGSSLASVSHKSVAKSPRTSSATGSMVSLQPSQSSKPRVKPVLMAVAAVAVVAAVLSTLGIAVVLTSLSCFLGIATWFPWVWLGLSAFAEEVFVGDDPLLCIGSVAAHSVAPVFRFRRKSRPAGSLNSRTGDAASVSLAARVLANPRAYAKTDKQKKSVLLEDLVKRLVALHRSNSIHTAHFIISDLKKDKDKLSNSVQKAISLQTKGW